MFVSKTIRQSLLAAAVVTLFSLGIAGCDSKQSTPPPAPAAQAPAPVPEAQPAAPAADAMKAEGQAAPMEPMKAEGQTAPMKAEGQTAPMEPMAPMKEEAKKSEKPM